MAIETHIRESVPFRVRTADGDTVELTYSSPRPAATHDERAVLETLPWFEPGKPLRNFTLAGGGLVVHGGAILHRYGLGSWQRGREVIWEKTLAALQVPIYHTIHGTGICEPGAGRWLDERTFVFNESVVANEEGLRQLEFVLASLAIELVVCHSPGWFDSTGHGNIGTSHMDMVMMTVDEGTVLLAPHRVNSA